MSLKCLRGDKWLKPKVKEIALCSLNNHLICIDSELRSISRALSTALRTAVCFCILSLASQATFIIAASLLVHVNAISKNPPLHFFPSFTLAFCLWTSPLSPNILCARTTCISSMQEWKLRLCGRTLSLKCHMLRPEYQLLVFDALAGLQ